MYVNSVPTFFKTNTISFYYRNKGKCHREVAFHNCIHYKALCNDAPWTNIQGIRFDTDNFNAIFLSICYKILTNGLLASIVQKKAKFSR